MATNRYCIKKETNAYEVKLQTKKWHGFQVTPKNQVPYEGIQVNQMTVIKPTFIEKVIKKKIKRRLDSYMQYIIYLLEEENDDGNQGINIALNDLERLKVMIRNKYQLYLDEKYVELLMKKIELLERELKIKKYYLKDSDLEEEKEKGRAR